MLLSLSFPDTYFLKSGETISGEFIKNTNGITILKTKYGELKIDNTNINKIEYSQQNINNNNKIQMIAYPLLEDYSLYKKNRRLTNGYTSLAFSGLFLFLGGSSNEESTKQYAYICSGIFAGSGAYSLLLESKAEQDIKSLKEIQDENQKEMRATLLLQTYAKEGRNERILGAALSAALSIYYVAGQPLNDYSFNGSYYVAQKSSYNMYYGLLFGAYALYYGLIESKEEEILNIYNKEKSSNFVLNTNPQQTSVELNYNF
jgi:hypothetical protein